MKQQAVRVGTARPNQPSRRSTPSRRGNARLGHDLLSLARLIAYALLLIATVRMGLLAWDAVQARRAQLAAGREAVESPFPRFSPGQEEQEGWSDPGLSTVLQKAIVPSSGTTAFYVKSLNTGATAAAREEKVYQSASLFKVPILVEVLRQQSTGAFNMGTRVKLEQKHWADGAGVLQAQIGKDFTVRELLDLMIRVSDNVAALALLDLVETDNVNLTMQANGLHSTRLRIGGPTKDWGGPAGQNTTTAREMGILMERLATGRLLDQAGTEEAIRILSQPQQVSWLPARLPAGVGVARKSGELLGVRHEAGIVYNRRSQFVVAVLNEEIGDYDAAAGSISGIARAAFDYLNR